MEECNKRKRVPSDSPDSELESKVHRVALASDVNSLVSELNRADSSVGSCEPELNRADSCVGSCEPELTPADSCVGSCESELTPVASCVGSCESELARVDSCVNSSDSELARVDSGVNSCDSELARVGSCVNSCESELTQVDSVEPCLNMETQDDLFNILDSENVFERDSAIQGLDSVIKSFEEEIFAPGSDFYPLDSNSVPDSSELHTNLNLGYLLEASDDELGLPPTAPESNKPGQHNPEELDLTGFGDFEDGISNYHVFGFDNELVAECDGDNSGARTSTAADWLFDYTESLQAM